MSRGRLWGVLGALIITCAMPAMASAQEEEKKEQDEIPGPLKDQLQEYWSVDRDLEVIKNRLYTRGDRLSVGVMAGVMPSEPFYTYIPVGARIGYHFSNELGVEVSGNYAIARPTSLTSYLERKREDAFDVTTDGGDKFVWRADATVAWHPLYGKWALLQRKLTHIDFSLHAGLGALGVQRPDDRRAAVESKVTGELVLGAGLHFFVTEDVTVRLDWRSRPYIGPAFDTSEELSARGVFARAEVPTDFTLGVMYMF